MSCPLPAPLRPGALVEIAAVREIINTTWSPSLYRYVSVGALFAVTLAVCSNAPPCSATFERFLPQHGPNWTIYLLRFTPSLPVYYYYFNHCTRNGLNAGLRSFGSNKDVLFGVKCHQSSYLSLAQAGAAILSSVLLPITKFTVQVSNHLSGMLSALNLPII
ncbi:hypothetical protein BKA70DRAFT_1220227 [Coprinopsis sp. MPI-PUGE-AT-0042]|nr:hypothetical protein BKA70DRAFT_1220227 [Coprinopsis sp. MPI-PUGE-AT-0042]